MLEKLRKLPFIRIQFFPIRLPYWLRRVRWQFRRIGYFLTDLLLILGGAAFIAVLWYLLFIE